MRRFLLPAAAWAVLLCGLGCTNESAQLAASPLKGKLDAAMAIRDGIKRDDALMKVAVDAASMGEVEVARKAVQEIHDGIKHDEAAARCAVPLAEQGKTKEATTIANLIRDGLKRDDTLSKIASARTGN
jgi:hypothetical protein